METDFRNCRVGDRVWSILYGWGEIEHISKDDLFPIKVAYNLRINHPDPYDESFTIRGSSSLNQNQTLFWDQISITPPPRPKRMVMKTVKVYAPVNHGELKHTIYDSYSEAQEDWLKAEIIELTGTYEVEE